MRRVSAHVTGLVQGVSFRYYTRREAMGLGLKGWVRNERDGSVQIVAEGSEATLEALLTFLEKGSPAARVSQVSVRWSAATGEFDSFEVRFA